jgi:hypothetical protein
MCNDQSRSLIVEVKVSDIVGEWTIDAHKKKRIRTYQANEKKREKEIKP